MPGIAQPWVRTSVNVSPEFHKLCRQYHIRFSEALRVGISMMLADKGLIDYDNNLNLKRKLDKLVEEIQRLHTEKK